MGERFWQSFSAGLRYVRSSPMLIGLPLTALLVNAALAPMEMLLPKRMLALGVGAGCFLASCSAGWWWAVWAWPGWMNAPGRES